MDNKTFFIADTHIGFGSRRTVSLRGFGSDWVRHEEYVIKSINDTINKWCTLYILGDVGSAGDYTHLKQFLGKLNTRRIHLCLGNHDNEKHFKQLQEEHVIVSYDKMYELKFNKQYFTLCHYPIFEWAKFYDNGYHLFGHTHNTVQLGWRSLDVGIDNIGYRPISIQEVINMLSKYDNTDKYKNKLVLGKSY